MSMNPDAFFGRIEIIFYSIVTSIMSGVHHARAHYEHQEINPSQSTPGDAAGTLILTDQLPVAPNLKRSINFSQAVSTILIWIILGFSAGFLIGMLNTG